MSNPTINPFVSEAQRHACYAADDPNWDCREWESKTPAHLPARVGSKTAKRKRSLKTNRLRCDASSTIVANLTRLDPTQTSTVRRAMVNTIRAKFAAMYGRVYQLIVKENALGLTVNAFCPTGEGGGVDPTCSPMSSIMVKSGTGTRWEREEEVVVNPTQRILDKLVKGDGAKGLVDLNTGNLHVWESGEGYTHHRDVGRHVIGDMWRRDSVSLHIRKDGDKLLMQIPGDLFETLRPDDTKKALASLSKRYGAVANTIPQERGRDLGPAVNQDGRGRSIKVQGLDIIIETAAGEKRRPEYPALKNDYGYIKGHKSKADGDSVDVFLGPDLDSEIVFIVDQKKLEGGFDEHKVMLGWTSAEDAKAAYHSNYSADWRGFRSIRALTMPQFKEWLDEGDTGAPIGDQRICTVNAFCPTGPGGGQDNSCAPGHGVVEIVDDIDREHSDHQSFREALRSGDAKEGTNVVEPYVYTVKDGKATIHKDLDAKYDYKTNKIVISKRPMPPENIMDRVYIHGTEALLQSAEQLKPGKSHGRWGANEYDAIYLAQKEAAESGGKAGKESLWGSRTYEAKIHPDAKIAKTREDIKAAMEKHPGKTRQQALEAEGYHGVVAAYTPRSDVSELAMFTNKLLTHNIGASIPQEKGRYSEAAVNANPDGCNQYTGPGCGTGEMSSDTHKVVVGGDTAVVTSNPTDDHLKGIGKYLLRRDAEEVKGFHNNGHIYVWSGYLTHDAVAKKLLGKKVPFADHFGFGVINDPKERDHGKVILHRYGEKADDPIKDWGKKRGLIVNERPSGTIPQENGLVPGPEEMDADERMTILEDPDTGKIPVVFYGTLLDPDTLAHVLGHHRGNAGLVPATIMGFRGHVYEPGDYPDIVRVEGSTVPGAIYQADEADFGKLEEWEASDGYRPSWVRTDRGWAIAFINPSIPLRNASFAELMSLEGSPSTVEYCSGLPCATYNFDPELAALNAFDPDQPRDEHGRFTSGGSFHALLGRLKSIGGHVKRGFASGRSSGAGPVAKVEYGIAKIRGIAAGLKDKMVERYGARNAAAIMISAQAITWSSMALPALGIPVIIPGSVATAMTAGIAEGIKQLHGLLARNIEHPPLSEERIRQLAEEYAKQLLRRWWASITPQERGRLIKGGQTTNAFNPDQPRDEHGRWASELGGKHEVSVSGNSFVGHDEAVEHRVKTYMAKYPDSNEKAVRDVARAFEEKAHAAPEEHWEAGRGRVFTHNHPTGTASLSKKDLETANERGYKTMIIVAPKDKLRGGNGAILIAHRPESGVWPSHSGWTTVGEHDKAMKDAGVKLDVQPYSKYQVTKLLKKYHGSAAHNSSTLQEDGRELRDGIQPLANTRWAAATSPQQLEHFTGWLRDTTYAHLTSHSDEQLWDRYVKDGFNRGARRAFDRTIGKQRRASAPPGTTSTTDYEAGARDQVLRAISHGAATKDAAQLLASRTFEEIKGVADDMVNRMGRALTDGLVRGKTASVIAADLKEVTNFSQTRCERIAHHELARSYNEGMLHGLKNMGVGHVGVEVEWRTTDSKSGPCEECAALEGTTFAVEDAHGMIPAHVGCLCAWMPVQAAENAHYPAGREPGYPAINANPYHDERGRFTTAEGEGSGAGLHEYATSPRVFKTPDDVKSKYDGWAGRTLHTWKDQPGLQLTGEPLKHEDLPEKLYHVTTADSAVRSSGVLIGGKGDGGMGGGQEQGVSFTTSKNDADLIQRELIRSVKIARGEITREHLDELAREDERTGNLPHGFLTKAMDDAKHNHDFNIENLKTWDDWHQKQDHYQRSVLKDAYNHYLNRRDSVAGQFSKNVPEDTKQKLKNPVLFGNQELLAKVNPAQIKTVEIHKDAIPKNALLTTGSDDFLHEVRAYSDVPVHRHTLNTLTHRTPGGEVRPAPARPPQGGPPLLRDSMSAAPAVNAFCPTGPGGGQDNSCSPTGTCYPDAYRLFRQIKQGGEPATLVHGEVTLPTGKVTPHAWVVSRGRVYPSGMKRKEYEDLMQAKKHSLYDRLTDVQIKMARSGHYGPWDETTDNAFCPTGQGGGIDPSCSPNSGTGASPPLQPADRDRFVGQKTGWREKARCDDNERAVAKAIKGEWEEDNKFYDARTKDGQHYVEVKTSLQGKKQEINAHPDALLRKVDGMAEVRKDAPDARFHTVFIDERNTWADGKAAEHYSGNGLYYKRGNGRYRIADMHPIKSMSELRRLMNTPDDQLPEKARGSLPSKKADVAKLRQQVADTKMARKRKDDDYRARLKAEGKSAWQRQT